MFRVLCMTSCYVQGIVYDLLLCSVRSSWFGVLCMTSCYVQCIVYALLLGVCMHVLCIMVQDLLLSCSVVYCVCPPVMSSADVDFVRQLLTAQIIGPVTLYRSIFLQVHLLYMYIHTHHLETLAAREYHVVLV